MSSAPKIYPFGTSAILLSWEHNIDENTSWCVRLANDFIKNEFADYITETNYGFNEIAVYLKEKVNVQRLMEQLAVKTERLTFDKKSFPTQIYDIPVCYNENFGPDLKRLCEQKEITREKFRELHSDVLYPIFFLGFLPGFPYLGGLNPKIAFPRKKTPSKKVPAGAVGIAGKQTGIYTIDSPGGWNIIGRTPLKLFDAKKKNPVVLRAGNYIRFRPIELEEYHSIEKRVKNGNYSIEKKTKK
ncbi:MAG: 5-oxoprolinase subunit PxpB [Brumimicrobium sp.]|nr:5-oxoprolinase subunit PxpB [Brumimicrobium sp.]